MNIRTETDIYSGTDTHPCRPLIVIAPGQWFREVMIRCDGCRTGETFAELTLAELHTWVEEHCTQATGEGDPS